MSNIEPEVPINYQGIADEHIAALQKTHDAVMAQLGGGVFIGPVSRRKLISTAIVPDKFFKVVSAALDDDPSLAVVSPGAPGRMRKIVPLSGAVRSMGDFYELLARSCRETDLLRRSEAGEDAFRVYNVAKSYNRARDPEQFIPRITAMKEALGARGRRSPEAKKKRDEAKAKANVQAPTNKDDHAAAVTPKETK